MTLPAGEPTDNLPMTTPVYGVAETNASGEIYATEEIAQAFGFVRGQGMLDRLRERGAAIQPDWRRRQ